MTRIINATAPIRICDNGGWTDTWFAEYGSVFNIAVLPPVEVQVEVVPRAHADDRIVVNAENYGDRYAWDVRGRHPLLEAAIDRMPIPGDIAIAVTIFSRVPAGASTGTSAAVLVALIGALDRLTPGTLTPDEVAATAHAVETDALKQQSGIQDQLCSAHGGINYIEMTRYPHATVTSLAISDAVWWELERRLALVFLGDSHNSSQVHEMVIRGLSDAGPESEPLRRLRATAGPSRDAVLAGDFDALGRAMRANTEAQGALHPALISATTARVIEIAHEHGALGWKVNGAGGEGGSITLLAGPRSAARRAMVRDIERENPALTNIPVALSRAGLTVWESDS